MSIETFNRNSAFILAKAAEWRDRCLVGDGSILSDESLWTAENLAALEKHFVQQPDVRELSFYEKLQDQLADASPSARRLMAEVLWALFLFPSNIGAETKRAGIMQVWGLSGQILDAGNPMLSDTILDGIGSGGMGVNTNRWREVGYIIGLGIAIKRLPSSDRVSVLGNYDKFVAWIKTVPQEGERQFRHMLRYILFPDRVERMSSNGDRRRVLDRFRVAPLRTTKSWSDQKLDEELFHLREQLERKHGTKVLDFYEPPLRDVWKSDIEANEPHSDEIAESEGVRENVVGYPNIPARPVNRIYYGPPGTGKTRLLQQLRDRYTDAPADVDRNTWEQELVARFGWRPVLAAAMADLGAKERVAAIESHPLVRAKALQRERRGGVTQTIWGYLQSHTPPEVETVRFANRREPFLFTKSADSEWTLVSDWRDRDSEAANLFDTWRNGPGATLKPIERYRFITFHPSYSYEDFVIGLRPVATLDDTAGEAVQFQMVDGVFKQVCAAARANSSKRYALFIDEINRANIAKVFGELITLIESDKRASYDSAGKLVAGLEVQLPGTGGEDESNIRFGVPVNLDIYGTMNTADRSIALLDIALRRRFEFEELQPQYDVIDRTVDGVKLARLLRTINDRLEFLADRDHRIGHAYLVNVKTLDDLRVAFQRQIIPLLQEYFFDDRSRIAIVLANGTGDSSFIRRIRTSARQLFGVTIEGADETKERYEITAPDSWTAAAFQSVYPAIEDVA